MSGWVKLYRALIKKPIWLNSTPEHKSILVTILLLANHEKSEWEWMGEKFSVVPGQFVTSLESIRKKTGKGISTQNVRSCLKRLQKLQFATDKATKAGRLITIINWDSYQPEEKKATKIATDDQQRTNKGPTPNKNDKNERMEEEAPIVPRQKKQKKKFDPPSKEDVVKYFIENEYDGNKGAEAFEFYDCADWFDSRGNKVKNWKQKMRGVWFKEDNKIIKNNGTGTGMSTGDQWIQMRRDRENAKK